MKRVFLIFFFLFLIFCGDKVNKPDSGITVRECRSSEVFSQLNVEQGKRMCLEASFTCPDKSCSMEWVLGEKLVSKSQEAEFTVCYPGSVTLTIRVKGLEDETVLERKIVVSSTEKPPERTKEVEEAINSLKEDTFILGYDTGPTEKGLEKILLSGGVLEDWTLNRNVCDYEAVYALSLLKLAAALTELQQLIDRLALITPEDIKALVDNLLLPAAHALKIVASAGVPDDFSFRVKNMKIKVLKDIPDTAKIQERLDVDLTGEHDTTDFYFLLSGALMLSGIFDILFSYNGAIDFLVKLPQRVFSKQDSKISATRIFEDIFIEDLAKNPAFLDLSQEAPKRLKSAQNNIYLALRYLQEGMNRLVRETDNQSDDIVRYWDCGKDNVCPGDTAEPFADVNENGIYDKDPNGDGKEDDREPYIDVNENGSWNKDHCFDSNKNRVKNQNCEEPDEGEGDYKYTIGEAIGTEALKTTRFSRIYVPVDTQTYRVIFEAKLFDVLADNIIGGILDLGKISGVLFGTSDMESLKKLACSVGIPFPEIRLWEFFISPTSMREMLPEWNPSTRRIIIQRDSEPFEDTGFDGRYSYQYESFHPFKNPDPDMDDFDPMNNGRDGVDTDSDGKCSDRELVEASRRKNGDEALSDRDCINYLKSPVDKSDWGLEGNFLFNYIDKNGNRVPDKGDLAEPWNDEYGILNGRSKTLCSKVCGNNKFDEFDVEHVWPDGRVDPRNGVGRGGMICDGTIYGGDPNGEMIDKIYLLWRDPTFSGVLKFYPSYIVNPEGENLNANGVFNRFLWKLYEFARSTGFIE